MSLWFAEKNDSHGVNLNQHSHHGGEGTIPWPFARSITLPVEEDDLPSADGFVAQVDTATRVPSGYVNSLLLKMTIYSGFSHEKW